MYINCRGKIELSTLYITQHFAYTVRTYFYRKYPDIQPQEDIFYFSDGRVKEGMAVKLFALSIIHKYIIL